MTRSFSGSSNEFSHQNQMHSSSRMNLNQSPIPMMTSSMNSDIVTDERDNLKTRIKALTQSLLEKQGLINNISADKQLLQIRVERLQAQIQEMADSSESNSNGGLTQTGNKKITIYYSMCVYIYIFISFSFPFQFVSSKKIIGIDILWNIPLL